MPGRHPLVRHTRPTILGVDRRTGTSSRAALIPTRTSATSPSSSTATEQALASPRGRSLAADLPVPAGGDLLAGAERERPPAAPCAISPTHDRVADALPEQQQEPEQRRQSDEQPRVVARRLGRRVGVERFERARARTPPSGWPVTSTWPVGIGPGARIVTARSGSAGRAGRTPCIPRSSRRTVAGRLRAGATTPVRVEPVPQFLERALQRDRAERDDQRPGSRSGRTARPRPGALARWTGRPG